MSPVSRWVQFGTRHLCSTVDMPQLSSRGKPRGSHIVPSGTYRPRAIVLVTANERVPVWSVVAGLGGGQELATVLDLGCRHVHGACKRAAGIAGVNGHGYQRLCLRTGMRSAQVLHVDAVDSEGVAELSDVRAAWTAIQRRAQSIASVLCHHTSYTHRRHPTLHPST